MILQALARYYDILAKDDNIDIALNGYSAVPVSYALNLSLDGDLIDIIPLFEMVQRGKKMEAKPRIMVLPERVKRTVNIAPNYLWDTAVYVLGLSGGDKTSPTHAQDRFNAFKQRQLDELAHVDSNAARALIAFLNSHDPAENAQHPAISRYLAELGGPGNLVFQVNGHWVHSDPAIKHAWEQKGAAEDAEIAQCLVSGDVTAISRLHPSLTGVRDARTGGASLISFNKDSFESYNRLQGMNSPVGEQAAFAYSTALNYLLSPANPNQKFALGDATVIYWAESDNRAYEQAYSSFMDPPLVEVQVDATDSGRVRAEDALKSAGQAIRKVQALDLKALLEPLQDDDPRFFVLGLSPNAARISVRFFVAEPFSKVVTNIMAHYADLEMVKQFETQPTYITIGQILAESVSKKSRDSQASPLLGGTLTRAVLANELYPAALFNAYMNRIRADMDDNSDKRKRIEKINYIRAAVIKAYLLRKYRRQSPNPFQEVLTVSLNEQATNVPYLLGRLFAVLEMAQRQAIGKNINATIKDRYFATACGSPRSVFPTLLRLSQHWTSKSKKFYTDQKIQEILNALDVDRDPFPARLSLDEQGIFVLGYYHQRAALYAGAGKDGASDQTPEDEQEEGEEEFA